MTRPAKEDQAKVARAWAENAITIIATIPTAPGLSRWIGENAANLGAAETLARDAWLKIRPALDARYRELCG